MVMIKCPCCRRRIFDTTRDTSAHIYIKCQHCKQVVEIDLIPQVRNTKMK